MAQASESSIEDKLFRAWQEQRRYIHLRGAGRLLVWLLALLLADFVIDWFILRGKAGGGFGLLLLLVNIAVLAWVAWHEWLRHLKPYDPLITALDVESRHPQLTSLLVSYTQLKGQADGQPNVSAELVGAMREQAVELAKPVNFREIVDFGQLRNLFFVMGGVVLFFLVISINWRGHFGTLFQRLAGVDAEYPTETQVTGGSGDLVVRFGDPATVSATAAAGVIPEAGQVFTRPAGDGDASWKALPLKKDDSGAGYSRQLEDLTADLEYYVRVGDDDGEIYTIDVIPSPRVVGSKIKLDYPSYMAREPGETDQLTFEAPEGTSLTWTLGCEPAVENLEVITGHGEEVEVELADGGHSARFSMVAGRPINYTFRWTEAGSGKGFQYGDVQHSVRIISDALPEVELLKPGTDNLATVKKKVQLHVRAADDNGLGEASLVYIVDGSAETRKPIHDFRGAASGEFELTWEIAEDIPELKPGMQIVYSVEVRDLYPVESAHLRRSVNRKISIVDPERYLQWYRSELAAQQDEIKKARQAEVAASTQVKQLREQEDDTP